MTPLLSTPLLRAQSDGRLTALAGSGHDRAFEEIVERYRRPLQRYLRRLLSEALAEDVLQATFVRAWQALRVGTEVRDLRPWMYRIAHARRCSPWPSPIARTLTSPPSSASATAPCASCCCAPARRCVQPRPRSRRTRWSRGWPRARTSARRAWRR